MTPDPPVWMKERSNGLLSALPAEEQARIKDEFERGGALQHSLLRYTQALITQMSQTAMCNRHQLEMTQELIANMLGVRREGVTEAAGKLQAAGLITYSRGHITVLDRLGLEAHVRECYAVVKRGI